MDATSKCTLRPPLSRPLLQESDSTVLQAGNPLLPGAMAAAALASRSHFSQSLDKAEENPCFELPTLAAAHQARERLTTSIPDAIPPFKNPVILDRPGPWNVAVPFMLVHSQTLHFLAKDHDGLIAVATEHRGLYRCYPCQKP